jgi:hypothetical protein
MITSLINKTSKYNKVLRKVEIMRKLFIIEEREGFHRVWNFVVPLPRMGNNNSIQSIPPLTKNSKIKIRKERKKSTS